MNRYAYCRNNPINYTDPTGLGWKKFWERVFNWFKDEVLQPLISFTVGFVFSGFNPVVGISAAIATASLDTGEGRQFMRRFGKEVFDDIFGMRPTTAYIWSAIVSHIAVTWTLERMIANMVADPAAGKEAAKAKDIPKEPKGIDPRGKYPGGKGQKGFELSQMKSLTDKTSDSHAVVGKSKVEWGPFAKLRGAPIHTGAASANFPASGMVKLVPDSWYGTLFGTCHQFTNATLLMSGISNTVAGIYPHWSTFLSTAVYGNYGGGLMRSVAVGVNSSQDYQN